MVESNIKLPIKTNAEYAPFYYRQKDEWRMINALLNGTGEIRHESTTYLPMLKNESKEQYTIRLSKAVLKPFFKRTVKFHTGKAFFKPIMVKSADNKSELSEKMNALIKDADKRQNSLPKFANTAFNDAYAKGLGYIYVDAPNYDAETIKTEADLKALKVRPYLLYVPAENLLDAAIDDDGSLIYVKMLERYIKFDDTQKKTVEKTRIRIVTTEAIGVYERKDENIAESTKPEQRSINEADEYMLVGDGIPNRLGMVTLVPIYTGEKKGDFEASSTLIDLAYSNVQYYQDESTHENAISVAEFPLLVVIGADGGDVEIGPHKMLSIKEPNGDLKYVEHSGAALEAGRKNLEDLRVGMAYSGLKSLSADNATRTRQQSATEAEIDSIDENSELKVAADNFVDAMDMALYYVQLYMGEIKINEQATVKADLDGVFSITNSDINEVAKLMELEQAGKMKLEALYNEMKRRNILDDDFDIDEQIAYANENADIVDIVPSTANNITGFDDADISYRDMNNE